MFKWVESGSHIINAISNDSQSNDFTYSDGVVVGKPIHDLLLTFTKKKSTSTNYISPSRSG